MAVNNGRSIHTDPTEEYPESTDTKSKIATAEEKRQAFRLKSLVIFLFTIALLLLLISLLAIYAKKYNSPSVIIITVTLASILTTTLGSIIGTSLK